VSGVFDYRRTPFLGLLLGAVIGLAVIWLVETPDRPLTLAQRIIFYALSCLPGLGIAMLCDPAPQRARAEYLKVDYYAPKDRPPAGE
jgi:hypothetical protein